MECGGLTPLFFGAHRALYLASFDGASGSFIALPLLPQPEGVPSFAFIAAQLAAPISHLVAPGFSPASLFASFFYPGTPRFRQV